MVTALNRRQVLLGLVVLGGGGALAACSTASGPSSSTAAGSPSSAGATSAPAPASSAAGSSAGAPALVTTDQVPVGGGVIVESGSDAFVVTQPAAGDFKCFSAVCPHQGCNCNRVADGTIDCPCHNSRFDIATGDVVQGPAKSGLAPQSISVSGTAISLA